MATTAIDDTPLGTHAASPAELQRAPAWPSAAATRSSSTAAATGGQQLFTLHPGLRRVTIGRGPSNDIALGWDTEVSRLHAELERLGGEWTLVDDGLSRNGTWLNGQRVAGRQRLRDGDVLQVGQTLIAFRVPEPEDSRPDGRAAATARAAR